MDRLHESSALEEWALSESSSPGLTDVSSDVTVSALPPLLFGGVVERTGATLAPTA
jgi:hypothetical protein